MFGRLQFALGCRLCGPADDARFPSRRRRLDPHFSTRGRPWSLVGSLPTPHPIPPCARRYRPPARYSCALVSERGRDAEAHFHVVDPTPRQSSGWSRLDLAEGFMSESEKEALIAEQSEDDRRRVSRRQFLKVSTAAVASAGAVTVGTAAALDIRSTGAQDATPSPATGGPPMPGMGTDLRPAQFFNIHEAQTVDAIASRILPGTADDPGAHEAGVVFYIDAT
jgi:hypothetical protein